MFGITSTRIIGLIAVICAFVVAPQALAASSTHSRIAPPGDEPSGFELGDLKSGRAVFTAATSDALQGYDLSGLDLSVLAGIRGYEHQDQYLKGLALAALAGATTKSVNVQPESLWRSPIGQPANNTPGGIVRASKSGKAAMFVYLPTNPGWGAAATAAKKSAAALAVKTAPVVWVCFDQAEYEYVYAGCE